MLKMSTKSVPKSSDKYYCEYCDYSTSRKSQYERHLETRKHNAKLGEDKVPDKVHYTCKCGKNYNHISSFSRHKKKCKKQIVTVSENGNEVIEQYKNLFVQLMSENKNLQELIIKQQEEFNKQQQEIIKYIKPSTTNNNCSFNNFNIQMFLNEKCKDAMSIQDFANQLVVTIEDLEKNKVDCLSNIILKNLKPMAITNRPVHCTNIKKKEWYIKDKDQGWELDNGDKLIYKAEYGINKNFRSEFVKHYPNFSTVDSLQDKFIKIVGSNTSELPEKVKSRLLNELAKELILNEDVI
jgi:hypothetical protein